MVSCDEPRQAADNIFAGKKDYQCFVALLQETSEMWGIRIAAYCLMPNHYHLLVHTPHANLSQSMRHVNGIYTQRYNRRHGCDGQLFRGRYKAIVVEEDSYLLQLVWYIHKNPVKAGVVESPDDYPWSSHNAYMSGAKKWDEGERQADACPSPSKHLKGSSLLLTLYEF
ncbi:MAG: transposase [Thermodesulfobacteriota bacterium]|nr:transposase [Thermodesulfobacteriota bacterium]